MHYGIDELCNFGPIFQRRGNLDYSDFFLI